MRVGARLRPHSKDAQCHRAAHLPEGPAVGASAARTAPHLAGARRRIEQHRLEDTAFLKRQTLFMVAELHSKDYLNITELIVPTIKICSATDVKRATETCTE